MNFPLPNDQEVELRDSMSGSGRINFFSKKVLFYVLSLVIVGYLFFFFFLRAPKNFPVGTITKVEHGSSLRSVSLKLKSTNIISSRVAFEAFVILFGGEKRVIESDYYFESRLPVYEVARRISKGEHRIAPISITIPEGFDVIQIADTFVPKLLNFDKSKFLLETQELEGKLFPDTYFFFITADEGDVIRSMSENFEKKMLSIRPDIVLSGKKEKDIIVMASILEREAKGDFDRELISGILWKRIKIGMPLQVDAALETYKTIGLPKKPISNPGLEAMKSAINPKTSSYLYYLHDKNGMVHYARTFAEHRQNIVKYLK